MGRGKQPEQPTEPAAYQLTHSQALPHDGPATLNTIDSTVDKIHARILRHFCTSLPIFHGVFTVLDAKRQDFYIINGETLLKTLLIISITFENNRDERAERF